jgi:hypothetical protein
VVWGCRFNAALGAIALSATRTGDGSRRLLL